MRASTQDRARLIDQALDEAHLPTLMVALVHLTGNTDHLGDPPVYPMFGDREGGISPDRREKIKQLARAALTSSGDEPPRPYPLSVEQIRQMMDFIGGAKIPERYVPFLLEELQITGEDRKTPRWDRPDLERARERLKVIIIGAGMSGLLAAIRLKQAGIAFEVVEKNPDVGGTWLENTYPGCRVDSDNHLYSYSFEPDHGWPSYFSTQSALLSYFQKCAEKYALRSAIRFETTVEEAVFDEKEAIWRVRVRDKHGREEVVEANAVISAVGQLNQPRYPDIPGRDSFAGVSFHSARYRHDVDLRGKRVAIIGTGASAFQIVPAIADQPEKLLVFQRTPPWLVPTPDYHDAVGEGKHWLLRNFPFYAKWYRFWLFWMFTDGFYEGVKVDPGWRGPSASVSEINQQLREVLTERVRAQLEDAPELLEHVVPEYPLGGKRAVRDNGVWLSALKRDNVELISAGIREITPSGLVTVDGVEHPVDVIIYATGFHASAFLSTMKVFGRGGVELQEHWRGDAQAYLGITIPGFPNLFCMYGPNTNIVVNGSIVFFSECSIRYILGCLELLAARGERALEPKREVHDAFNEKIDEGNRGMAWGTPQVSSWYKNAFGRVSQNWPFPLVDYWQATLEPDAKDFVFWPRAGGG